MFDLDPAVTYLNHGSFGAVPRPIADVQSALRLEMEREPVDFLVRRLPGALDAARQRLAPFLGADPRDLVFVRNATAGVAAVLAHAPTDPGDEWLTTSHRYGAVGVAMATIAARRGATVKTVEIPFPPPDPEEVVALIRAAIGPRTRGVVVDAITSPTALRLPFEEIVGVAQAAGAWVLVDGAHTPGHLDVDLDKTGADFWTGNLHKWLCAPRGCALLHVARRWQPLIRPTIPSHDHETGFQASFDWVGTDDPTPWLAAPAALDWHEAQGGAAFRARNLALCAEGASIVAEALGVADPRDRHPAFRLAMCTLPTPGFDANHLHAALRDRGIEVPCPPWSGASWIRISAFSAYNRPEHYVALARALRALA
jgi:isopenicillin-N epimerase